MKYVFLFFVAAVLFSSCNKETTAPDSPLPILENTFINYRFKDKYTTAQLVSKLSVVYPNIDSVIQPKYDVTAFRIFYKTHDFQNHEVIASGLVYVPEIVNYKCPVVCFQHGTAIQKQEVPSISADLNYYVPFIMASETGTIVCAADYIGLGYSDGVHHYYNPEEEANAVVDMLGSVQPLLNKTLRKILFNSSVFLMGYSQGGHATLAAQRLLETKYTHQFKLMASAPMASWFSLEQSTQLNVLSDAVSFPFPSAYAFLLNSIQATAHPYSSYDSIFVAPYDSLTSVLFDGTKSMGYINTKYPEIFSTTLQPYFKNDIKNNPENRIKKIVKTLDVLSDWTPHIPTRFYHSHGDEIAFYDNSEIAYSTFHQRGGNVELIDLGNLSHFDGNLKAIQEVRNWFYPMLKITPY
ncbi:MAG TPA: lipase family protein [Chitinophagales bacterium]|nr:lipase family protein [Chitinophagales bacterium]